MELFSKPFKTSSSFLIYFRTVSRTKNKETKNCLEFQTQILNTNFEQTLISKFTQSIENSIKQFEEPIINSSDQFLVSKLALN